MWYVNLFKKMKAWELEKIKIGSLPSPSLFFMVGAIPALIFLAVSDPIASAFNLSAEIMSYCLASIMI